MKSAASISSIQFIATALLALVLQSSAIAGDDNDRLFDLSYGMSILDVPENASIKVWFPIAQSNDNQTVTLLDSNVPGSGLKIARDPKFNNKIGFFELRQGNSTPRFELNYQIHRKETRTKDKPSSISAHEKQLFLQENRLVPLTGKPTELLSETNIGQDSLEAGRALYNVVERHMSYDKSKSGYGNGDVLWACDSRTGNCTDFHSLFISLARIKSIPARFEIGFPIPSGVSSGSIKGYHCWAWFHTEKNGWVPVDISEADKHPEMLDYYFGNLTANRVAFSTGRDIQLVPKSQSGPLNFFIYPHVEVDGKVWPKEKLKLQFSFKDAHDNVQRDTKR